MKAVRQCIETAAAALAALGLAWGAAVVLLSLERAS